MEAHICTKAKELSSLITRHINFRCLQRTQLYLGYLYGHFYSWWENIGKTIHPTAMYVSQIGQQNPALEVTFSSHMLWRESRWLAWIQMSTLQILKVRWDKLPLPLAVGDASSRTEKYSNPFSSWNWLPVHAGEVFNDISETSLVYLEFTLKDYICQCFQVILPFEMLIRWNWPLPPADICISKRFLAHLLSVWIKFRSHWCTIFNADS